MDCPLWNYVPKLYKIWDNIVVSQHDPFWESRCPTAVGKDQDVRQGVNLHVPRKRLSVILKYLTKGATTLGFSNHSDVL